MSITKNCLNCNKPFSFDAYRINTAKFCSKKCADIGQPRDIKPPEERFWAFVQKTENCWLWTGTRSKIRNGSLSYGRFTPATGEKVFAHRYSFELANGPIPPGMYVLHHCDVMNCVNPAHLFLGTPADNVTDMISKGRHSHGVEHGAPGEKNGRAKITNEQAKEIRQAYASGDTTLKQLANLFGISRGEVGRIVRYKSFQLT